MGASWSTLCRSWVVLGGSWAVLSGSWVAQGSSKVSSGLGWLRGDPNSFQNRVIDNIAPRRLLALLEASCGGLDALWASLGAVCVAPGLSLGGSRTVGTYRNSRNASHPKSKSRRAFSLYNMFCAFGRHV